MFSKNDMDINKIYLRSWGILGFRNFEVFGVIFLNLDSAPLN